MALGSVCKTAEDNKMEVEMEDNEKMQDNTRDNGEAPSELSPTSVSFHI